MPDQDKRWPEDRPFAELEEVLTALGMRKYCPNGFKLEANGVDVYLNVGVDKEGVVTSVSVRIGNTTIPYRPSPLAAALRHVTAAAEENVRRELRKILDVPANEDLDRFAAEDHTHDIR